MGKTGTLSAAVAAAALAAAAPARAFFVKNPFQCGVAEGRTCCFSKLTGDVPCAEGLVCVEAFCRKCGVEGTPVCKGPCPCLDGFVLEHGACVPEVDTPDDGCGSLDELCCVGNGGFSCDDGLACDRNVQALLGPGICRECGSVAEIPCADGGCDDGLDSVTNDYDLSICVDPEAPPPPPCGATGEPCCTGLDIPFDASGCEPDNLCAFVEGSPAGVCEACGATGEQCCVEQNDDILTVVCSEGNVCGDEGACVTCGNVREPCCATGPFGGELTCNTGLICNSSAGVCEFEAVVEGQAPVDDDVLEEDPTDADEEVTDPPPEEDDEPEPSPEAEEEEEEGPDDGGKDAGSEMADDDETEIDDDVSKEPEPVDVAECCSDELPICCSGTCITLEDAAAASCLAGATCCGNEDPEEPEEPEGKVQSPTGNPVDVDIQEGVAVAGTRPPNAPPVDTSKQQTVRTEEAQEIDDGVTRGSRVSVSESTV